MHEQSRRDSHGGIGRNLAGALLPLLIALLAAAARAGARRTQPIRRLPAARHRILRRHKRVAATLAAATPLILTGLATAVAFRAGAFNVGVEGCVFVGGLAAAYVGFTFVGLPAGLLIPLALAASVVVGALWMLLPGVLKARLAWTRWSPR